MKNCLYFFLFLYNVALFSQDESCFDLKQVIETEKSRYAGKSNYKTTQASHQYDVTFHRLDVIVDPAINYIRGGITTYFVPKVENFDRIIFDFSDSMNIVDVNYHSNPISFTHNNDKLTLNLGDTLQQDLLDSIYIHYDGIPQSTGHGSFVTEEHNSTPVMWTLSEPYGAKSWWPCKEDLNDKIDSLELIIRAPSQYRSASNGLLVKEESTGGITSTVWKHDYPIAHYLVAFAVTNYVDFTDYATLNSGDSLPILNYVYPENLSAATTELKQTVDIMELFDDLFGAYPFANEKYGHADFGWGGGMEHQTMSFMGSYSFDLVSHELAHQWFGNKITCSTWPELWLNEGFATYASGLCYEHLDPYWWMTWKEVVMDKSKVKNDLSIHIEDTTDIARMFNENTYYKGAALIHMLRWVSGDENFFLALKNYITNPALAYAAATTNQFKTEFETVLGQNLDEFFNDWYYGKGYPTYQLGWDYSSGEFHLKASQTTSNNAVSFFEMPIPIRVYGNGQDSLLKLDHTFNGQQFDIVIPFKVDSIAFNDELQLLTGTNTITKEALNTKLVNSPQFSLHPNPATSSIHLRHFCENCEKKISCTNQIGELIHEFYSSTPNDLVDISTWPRGTYLIKVQSDYGAQSTLFVKQ